MARDQLVDLFASNPAPQFFPAGPFCAKPRLLDRIRVPARMLGNVTFPNGFEGFPYAMCGPQTAKNPTEMHSIKLMILFHAFRVRERALQPMVFHDFQ